MSQATCTWDNTTASRKRTRTKRYNEESRQAGGIRQTPGYLQKQPCHLPEETCVQLLCAASYDTWCRDLDTDQTSTEQTCGRTDQNGKKYAQITYKDRMTNIWVRERTKLIDIIYTVRKMKWSWAGHINRLKDDRWTSTWRRYDKKRRQGRPAKGGETTWTNTGATRYGRGQHRRGSFGDDVLRPSPNHGTQQLPNDDDDEYVFGSN